MIIDRILWLDNTLNAFDFELILRLQPDNINKLPKLDQIDVLIPHNNFRHAYGFSKFISGVANPIPSSLINNTSLFKAPKDIQNNIKKKSKKELVSVRTRLFPHHHNLNQLLPFFLFYFCLKNNTLCSTCDYSINDLSYKINNLNYFTCYQWYFDRGSIDWGTLNYLLLKSYHGINFFGPLFKAELTQR